MLRFPPAPYLSDYACRGKRSSKRSNEGATPWLEGQWDLLALWKLLDRVDVFVLHVAGGHRDLASRHVGQIATRSCSRELAAVVVGGAAAGPWAVPAVAVVPLRTVAPLSGARPLVAAMGWVAPGEEEAASSREAA